MSIHAASKGHTDKAAEAAKVLSQPEQKLKEGGTTGRFVSCNTRFANRQQGCRVRLMETQPTPLSSVSKSSAAANDTHEMETDKKELPEDLLVDDVTMIAEAENEVDYESFKIRA